MLNVEQKLMQQVAPNQTFETLPLIHKLEVGAMYAVCCMYDVCYMYDVCSYAVCVRIMLYNAVCYMHECVFYA